ncbi:mRNA export factor MEX67 [Hyphodiscus hymeniophilus]|uniref:mRNA export factor MEX67 n=1 Tax=Hyphodiscus hymeniophilus TaxID=353542 RepID=A0A9P6VP13_9HELO|nr:mRNA export factor MEX67 [Hyphodiscus hymeniophilus]
MQRVSAPPRGPRSGGPTARGGGRGGIQKRTAGPRPVKVDKDGDLDMDAGVGAAGRGKSGKGRFESPVPSGPKGAVRGRAAGPARGGSTRATQHAIERGLRGEQVNVREGRLTTPGTTLQVEGLMSSKAASNSDGGLQSLEGFLERKASGRDSKSNRTVKIKKSHLRGDLVIITASQEDIEAMLKLDQFSFAGATLTIKPHEPAPPPRKEISEKTEGISPGTAEIKDKLKAILASRYDVDLKLLNLSSLGQDAGLLEMGLGSLDGKTTSKLFPALMVVCDSLFDSWKAKQEAIVSVTLAGNGLSNVTNVTALAQTFPDLKNLDLSGNNIAEIKGLESWRWKFRHLENLVLTGNPLETQTPNYNIEILKWYPKLLTLNGVQVRTPEQVAAATESINSPIPISGPDFRDVGQVGENFVRQFLPLYDSDRTALLSAFYDAQSCFSMSINMSAPRDRTHGSPIPPWAIYLPHSRNLTKINNINARMSRQYRGIDQIQKVWTDLPATRHPDISTQADKYLIECHPQPGLADPSGQSPHGVDGLLLIIHGEFEEEINSSDKGSRGFSRTFILGPGTPGGPPIRVVSDMMILRANSPLAVPSHPLNPTQSSMPAPGVSPEQHQETVTKQLVEKTGMTPEYAMLCLMETGWDLNKAFVAFNVNKVIPYGLLVQPVY